MISVAAHAIGGIVDASKPGAAVLPPVTKLDQFSETVAIAVAEEAGKEGFKQKRRLRSRSLHQSVQMGTGL